MKEKKVKYQLRTINKIVFFGFADAKQRGLTYKNAFSCAQFLAQKGYTIVNGGGPGVMRAATSGAKAANGKTIGVTFYPKEIVSFEGRDEKNFIDREIVARNYLERTMKLLEIGDCYVIFRGGTGTISEFGMAWGLAKLYFGHHKPLILYGKFWEEIIAAFKKHMNIRPTELKVFRTVSSPKETLEALNYFENLINRKKHKHLSEKTLQI